MKYSYINILTKRSKKTAHVFCLIALALMILSIAFGQAALGDGILVSLFTISNFTGFMLLFSDWILIIIVLLIGLYHLGEQIF